VIDIDLIKQVLSEPNHKLDNVTCWGRVSNCLRDCSARDREGFYARMLYALCCTSPYYEFDDCLQSVVSAYSERPTDPQFNKPW